MSRFSSALLLMLCLSFLPSKAQPQSATADGASDFGEASVSATPAQHRYREISIYTSQTIANPQIMSDLGGQHLFLAGGRLTSRLITARHLFIGGNADVKPVALYWRSTSHGREYTYGGGGSVGLQFAPRRVTGWQPYFDVDGGFLAFPHDVPLPNTRRVNMMLDFGPGLRIPLRGNDALRTGVWFFHFSNGNTAVRNPGFDSFMVYAAYTYRNFVPRAHREASRQGSLSAR